MKKKVMKMICPKCHNENKYDALTCDFCMARLPMTKAREEEIKRKQKIEKIQYFIIAQDLKTVQNSVFRSDLQRFRY